MAGSRSPYLRCDAAVQAAKERWNVCAFFADVNEWEEHTKITWREMFEGDEDACGVFRQARPSARGAGRAFSRC